MKLRLAVLSILTLVLVPLAPAVLGVATAAGPGAPAPAQSAAPAAPGSVTGQSAFDPLFGVAPDHAHAPGTAAHSHAAAAPLDAASPADQRQQVKSDKTCMGGGATKLPQSNRCTHGPDPAPPGLNIAQDVGALSSAAAVTPAAQCVGDGSSGLRIQVLYVRAAGVPSRFVQFRPSIRAWADDVNAIFRESAAETGGARAVRYVHNAACEVIVTEVVLTATGDDNFDNTIVQLDAKGYNRTDRKYMIFMDANVYCGIGSLWLDDRPVSSNINNNGPSYGRTDAGCWGSEVPAHELMHNLGAVQLSAPNDSGGFHCVDEWDVMCYSDEPDFPTMVIRCPDTGHDRLYDCNHNDYFHTNPAAGSYLRTHWNSATNGYLVGGTPPPPCADPATEPDNTRAQANAFVVGTTQAHAFCTSNDEDWVFFQAAAGREYRIETLDLAIGTDTVLDLYASNGTTRLAGNDDRAEGDYSSLVVFTPTAAGRLYVKASPYPLGPVGNRITYRLRITAAPLDTTDPSLVITAPPAGAHITTPSVVIRATARDGGSGVASVLFRRCRAGTCVTIGTDTIPTADDEFSVLWNVGSVPPGTYAIQVTATDGAGNATTVSRNVVVE